MQSLAPARQQTLSYFTPYGYQSGSCGYCKDPESSASYYVKSDQLTVTHYQILMDRGWRRSGTLLYLPDNRRSCCPHYTIRLPTKAFKPSRGQRQTLNRWNRFVLGETYQSTYAKLHPISKAEKKALEHNFDLVSAVHGSETDKIAHVEPKPANTYTVQLEPDDYTEEKYNLFEKYQRIVHKEQPSSISKGGFKRFLCSSPLRLPVPLPGTNKDKSDLTPSEVPVASKSKLLGSYHQLHRLNGALIALSVLDLLEHAVSAVYFIYDPSFENYGLGKLSALRETALAEEHGYNYYYMGYYIHDCSKMKYKAEFKPQEVLDASLGATDFSWKTLNAQVTAQMTAKTFGLPSLDLQAVNKPSASDNPVSAARAGISLLNLGIPSVLPTSMLLPPHFDMGSLLVSVRSRAGGIEQIVPARMLTLWDDDNDDDSDINRDVDRATSEEQAFAELEDSASVKGAIAEFVAAVGLDVARTSVVKFTTSD